MPKRTNPFQQLIAMVVELLENGSVVTESVEYRDPAANNLREVDITVVRGQLGGKPVRIGIECTDLGGKRLSRGLRRSTESTFACKWSTM